MRKSIIFVWGALAAAVALADITGEITSNGETQKGAVRWSTREKAYVVTLKGGVEMQIKAAEVEDISIDKPAALDAAVALVHKGQASAAVPTLQKIVKEYNHLVWDKTAGRYLAEAYVAAGKPDDALRACADIIKGDPAAAYSGDLAPAYWSALLSTGKKSTLEAALAKAAKGDDVFAKGAALTMRGDILWKDGGESADAAKKALTDGYLRTVFLYRNAEGAERLLPEALYKAAVCFEKLGQSARADKMRTDLKRDFASSPWAAK